MGVRLLSLQIHKIIIGSQLNKIIIFFALALTMCESHLEISSKPNESEAKPIIKEEAKAPPCIHQNCFERPSDLDCTHPISGACWHYKIIYEHHCDCDQWAPNEKQQN